MDGSENATVQALDSALEKLPVYQGTVTRDLNFMNLDEFKAFATRYAIGSEITDPSFVSATVSTAYQDAPQVRLLIQSKTARDLRGFNPEEAEVLFRRYTKFRVLAMRRAEGTFVLEVEET